MTKAFESISTLIAHFPSGSRVICDPAPTDTDEDHVLLVSSQAQAQKQLVAAGYKFTTDPSYNAKPEDVFSVGTNFKTYRKGEENLIVVDSIYDYRRWQAATQLAKRFNLLNKQDRIDLFKAIRHGNLD